MTEEHVDYLPTTRTPWNEGKTLAAWLTTWILLAGGVAVALGFVLPSTVLIVVGGVVIVLGLLVGRILAILGHGKNGAGTAKRDRKALAAGRSH
ncbi:MAG: hypothetical protein GX593_04310 [Actinomycetales bacterium]|nr:hypothetical protein [Actinomycetales bacterium]